MADTHIVVTIAFYIVIGCWFVFLLSFVLRKRVPRGREWKHDHTAVFGMALEGVGYYAVWGEPVARRHFTPLVARSSALAWVLSILAVAIAVGSVYLVDAACRRLGKQWALSARLVEDHTLVQDGPYRFVRNPIYLGMLGMLIATGLLRAEWIALLSAILIFIAGTYIRVRSEERLLREAFGNRFDEYTRRVPALIPGVY